VVDKLMARRSLQIAGASVLFLVAGVTSTTPAWCTQAGEVRPHLPVEGKLVQLSGRGPVLQVMGRDFKLSARTSWLLDTLKDKRLANREIRVEGEWQPDGKLKVNHFFTVHDGKLYHVRYFCKVCNIEALGPGNCICCQQPTEMQEIPVPEKP
jgi:hypothetical protein